MLCESSLKLMEWDFRIALGYGVSISSWIQSGSDVLVRATSNFEFCRLFDINDARCGAIGFWGMIRASGLENKGFH